ncbi:MAG TPA: chemotaxis protein CheW [Gammaproteobacteria bacterium]
MTLSDLKDRPFELLVALEQKARAAIASRAGQDDQYEEWIGVGFKLGAEGFIAARSDVREVLAVPDTMTRVPGAKSWLRGIANVRGQLITIIDLKAFLGGGVSQPDRHSRVLVLASRDVPTGMLVDEVVGFRRFNPGTFSATAPRTVIRCDHYLEGSYERDGETWPCFSLARLLKDDQFLRAGEDLEGRAVSC